MTQYKAFDSNVKVRGKTLLSFVQSMGELKEVVEFYLENNGIDKIEADNWYPIQNWLDTLQQISTKIGPSVIKRVGQEIPYNTKWPSMIDSIDTALSLINSAYQQNRKNGTIGNYKFQAFGEKKGRMLCLNPYPCEFDKGLIEGTIRKFGGKLPIIKHESRSCRSRGADSCTYIIEWS